MTACESRRAGKTRVIRYSCLARFITHLTGDLCHGCSVYCFVGFDTIIVIFTVIVALVIPSGC